MEIPKGTFFIDTLDPNMTKKDFMNAICHIATEDDKKNFGDDYEEQLANAVLYPAVFAPFPATFDSVAIAGIIDNVGASDLEKNDNPTQDLQFTDIKINRTAHLIGRMIELGVIEPSDMAGRYFVRQETITKLTPILNQFE